MNNSVFSLDEFLTQLDRLLKENKNKHLRALFVGAGEVLPCNHGFREGGLVHYLVRELDRQVKSDPEAIDPRAIDPEAITDYRYALTADMLEKPTQQFFSLPNVKTVPRIEALKSASLKIVADAADSALPVTSEQKAEPDFILAPNLRPNKLRDFLPRLRKLLLNWQFRRFLEAVNDNNLRLPQILSFVSRGADANLQNSSGWTALHLLTRYEALEMVQAILAHQPDVNLQNSDGWTVLQLAACYGTLEMVQAILAHQPDINLQDSNGWTVLHFTARHGTAEMVQILLDAGADPTMRTKYTADENGTAQERQCTALMLAANNENKAERNKITHLLSEAEIRWNEQKTKGVLPSTAPGTSSFIAHTTTAAPAEETLQIGIVRHHHSRFDAASAFSGETSRRMVSARARRNAGRTFGL